MEFGNRVNIGHHNEISCFNDIKVGDNSFTAAYVYIGDYSHSFTDSEIPVYKQELKLGKTEVGANVWIGRGAMILKGSLIGDNSIIGANCTISNHIDKDKIAVVSRPTIIEKKK
ncbi:acyltransferase [Pseudoalteromonas xiamenensis]